MAALHSCSACREEKPAEAFYKNWRTPTGLHYTCKECQKNQALAWARDNQQRYLWLCARRRAKKKGLEFNIDVEDIPIPSHCPILGIPLKFSEGRAQDDSATVDRWDNTKGYVKGNVNVVSMRANRIKSQHRFEDLEKCAEWIRSHTK